ncbi:MAG: DUF177 domain-containing protein [Bacteroidales bacterium]|nr:DUF177 domain-containing protein [Bacteroidales bacterium]
MSQFIVPVKGIKDGIHFFELSVEDKFFESFDNEDISGGKIDIKLEVKKSTLLTSIKFSFNGYLSVPCDRCLDYFNLPFSFDYEMFVKYSDGDSEDDDKLIFLKHDEHELDILPYIYELILLGLPLKKVHPDKTDGSSGCNSEMLKHLNQHIIHEEKDTITPWDNLKNLFSN